MRIYGALATALGKELTPYLHKGFISDIVIRIRDFEKDIQEACAEGLGAIARYCFPYMAPGQKYEENSRFEIAGMLYKPLFQLLGEHCKNTQEGAAFALAKVISNSDPNLLSKETTRMSARLLKMFASKSLNKAGICTVASALIESADKKTLQEAHIRAWIDQILETLYQNYSVEDWKLRKAIAELLEVMALKLQSAAFRYKRTVLTVLNVRGKFDKIKPAREAFQNAIIAFEELIEPEKQTHEEIEELENANKKNTNTAWAEPPFLPTTQQNQNQLSPLERYKYASPLPKDHKLNDYDDFYNDDQISKNNRNPKNNQSNNNNYNPKKKKNNDTYNGDFDDDDEEDEYKVFSAKTGKGKVKKVSDWGQQEIDLEYGMRPSKTTAWGSSNLLGQDDDGFYGKKRVAVFDRPRNEAFFQVSSPPLSTFPQQRKKFIPVDGSLNLQPQATNVSSNSFLNRKEEREVAVPAENWEQVVGEYERGNVDGAFRIALHSQLFIARLISNRPQLEMLQAETLDRLFEVFVDMLDVSNDERGYVVLVLGWVESLLIHDSCKQKIRESTLQRLLHALNLLAQYQTTTGKRANRVYNLLQLL